MKIGVTGTREGASNTQLQAVINYMISLGPDHELHHGDCVGVDEQVAMVASELGWKVVCHPPIKEELRAHHRSDEFRKPLGYLARDKNIVDETEMLIVVPKHNKWQSSGGTWYTHDHAIKTGKPVKIFYPGE